VTALRQCPIRIKGCCIIKDSVILAKLLKEGGCDFINASSGGIALGAKIP